MQITIQYASVYIHACSANKYSLWQWLAYNHGGCWHFGSRSWRHCRSSIDLSAKLSDAIGSAQGFRSDYEYKQHFEELHNETIVVNLNLDLVPNDIYIPMVDNPITFHEVSNQDLKFHSNKDCCTNYVPLGLLQLHPAHRSVLS